MGSKAHPDTSAAGAGESTRLALPRLYAVLDMDCIRQFKSGLDPNDSSMHLSAVCEFAGELAAGGVTLLQLRGKNASARHLLSRARELKRLLGSNVKLIMNDRADLCFAAGFDGVHLGQDDLSAEGARKVLGSEYLIGVSTHNEEQLRVASNAPVDYLAIGPIFATATKVNPDPVVGLDGLRAIRRLTAKPLVAIGGITRQNARSVIDAGADSVAVISDLVNEPRRSAEDFLRILM